MQAGAVETVGLEWGHGRVHRLITKSAVQTHAPSLEFVAGQWLCQRVQHRFRAKSFTTKRSARLQAKPGGRPAQPGQGAVPKKRKGGGGAWRAFVSKRRRGLAGGGSFNFGAEYREAKERQTPEYLEAVRAGKAATQRAKATGAPAFGERTRATRRKQLSALTASRAATAQGRPGELSAAANLIAGPHIGAVPNLKEEMTLVRKETLQVRRQQHADKDRELQRLRTYVSDHQPALIEQLMTSLPDIGPLPLTFHLQPAPQMALLEFVPDFKKTAVQAAAWAASHSRESNLHTAFLRDWKRRHLVVGDTLSAAELGSQVEKSLCVQYGHCVKSRSGRQAFAFRNAFLRTLRNTVDSKAAETRALLADGFIAIKLIEEKAAVDPRVQNLQGIAASFMTEDEDVVDQETAFGGEVWFHLGMQYFKPYRPTLQRLEEVAQMPGGRTVLRQLTSFYTDMELAVNLDLESTWSVEFHQLVSSTAPVVPLQPSRCVVQPWRTDLGVMWPVQNSRTGRRQAGRRVPRGGARRRPAQEPPAAPQGDAAQVTGEEEQMHEPETNPEAGSGEEADEALAETEGESEATSSSEVEGGVGEALR